MDLYDSLQELLSTVPLSSFPHPSESVLQDIFGVGDEFAFTVIFTSSPEVFQVLPRMQVPDRVKRLLLHYALYSGDEAFRDRAQDLVDSWPAIASIVRQEHELS